jgi:hypothetical protein
MEYLSEMLERNKTGIWRAIDLACMCSMMWIQTCIFENDLFDSMYDYPLIEQAYLWHFLVFIPIFAILFLLLEYHCSDRFVLVSTCIFCLMTG